MNLPPVALKKHHGNLEDAHFRNSHWHRGEWTDDLVFAMLKEEWERERQSRPASQG